MQPAGSLGIPRDLLAQEFKSPDLSPRQDYGFSKQEDSQGALDPGPLMSYPVTQAAQSRGPDSSHLADLKGVPASVPKAETMMGFLAACTKGQFVASSWEQGRCGGPKPRSSFSAPLVTKATRAHTGKALSWPKPCLQVAQHSGGATSIGRQASPGAEPEQPHHPP